MGKQKILISNARWNCGTEEEESFLFQPELFMTW